MGYANNATKEGIENNKDTDYKDTVQNFGAAFAVNLTVFQQLLEFNQNMSQNMANDIQNLQAQMQNLTTMMHNMLTQ